MQTIWSTESVSWKERLSYWAEAASSSFVPLEFETTEAGERFFGRIEQGQLAALKVSRVTADAQSVRRTQENIAGSTDDYFLVSIQMAGQGVLIQDGREATLEPGDFALYDSTRPYEFVLHGKFQHLVLTLPRPVLQSRLGGTETLTACKIDGRGGTGRLMTGMVKQLVAEMGILEPASVAAVAESVENILVAALSTLSTGLKPATINMALLRQDQIKAYVMDHLRDPALSVERIAAHLRVTPSTLHRSFANEPCTLNSWIWAKRLDGARRDLCDLALSNCTITEIAFSWAFNDAAHFSRAFRARFGCSPSDLRSNSLASHQR